MARQRQPRYKMGNRFGDIPKGKIVYLSLHHRPTLDGHRMVAMLECGKGAGYSVPEGLLIPVPYDEVDDDDNETAGEAGHDL